MKASVIAWMSVAGFLWFASGSTARADDPTYELDVIFILQQEPLLERTSTSGGSTVALADDAKDDAEFVSMLIAARQSTVIPLKLGLTGSKEAETNNYDKSAIPSSAIGEPEVKKEKEPTVGQRVKASIKDASKPNPSIILDVESVNPPMIEDRTGQKFFQQRQSKTELNLPMNQWIALGGGSGLANRRNMQIGDKVKTTDGNETKSQNEHIYLRLRKR